MGCTLATSAKINKALDARRARPQFDSSEEDSDALEDHKTQKSIWVMNKSKGLEEKKKRALEYRQ